MKKVLITIILTLTLLVSVSSVVFADYGGLSGDFSWYFESATGTLTLNGKGDYVNAPWQKDLPSYTTAIKKVVVTDGITSIGERFFINHPNITEVVLADSVEVIGDSCFYNCTSIEKLTLSASLKVVGESAFYGCGNIKELSLPDGIETVGKTAFYGLKNIGELILPESLKYIGDSAFEGCENARSLVIPGDLEYLGNAAFKKCGFESVVFPEEFSAVPEQLLMDNKNLASVDLPSSVQDIGACAFGGCTSMKSFVIPDGVSEIKASTFANCSSLEEIVIPDTVHTIGNQAFDGCSSMKSFELPAAITSIGNFAFQSCTSLEVFVVPVGINKLGAGMFRNCTSLVRVQLHDNITDIGMYTFLDCTSLESITIPGKVKEIGYSTFWGCTSLKSLTIEEGVEVIDDAFRGCTALESLILPSTVKTIKQYAFYECTGLESISFNEGLTGISRNAFSGCSSLKSLVFPTTLGGGSDNAFENCTSLESVKFNGTLTTISEYMFANCTSLKTVEMCDSIVNISERAFSNCTSLTDVKLSASLETIQAGAFRGTAISEIVLPETLKYIYNPFYGCDNLTELRVPASVRTFHIQEPNVHMDVYFEGYELPAIRSAHRNPEAPLTYHVYCNAQPANSADSYEWSTYMEIELIYMHDYEDEWTVDFVATENSTGQKSRHCKHCLAKTDIIEIAKKIELIDSSEKFIDVTESWAKAGIDYVVSYGYMNGTGNGSTFSPTGTMSRSMIVTVLYRIAGQPIHSGNNPFADVDDGWYYDAVLWAYENGIVTGTSATTFAPNGDVTREQMATFLYRFAKYMGYDTSAKADLTAFPDEGKVGSWAKDALAWANAEGLVTGAVVGGETVLNPAGYATREQVATVLMRFCMTVIEE